MEPGSALSHYKLIEKIGEGSMGIVWKAEDTVLNRTVAIKVLPPDVSRDESRRLMFLNEARLASQVSNAHIVQVHEFGGEGDLDFIVMEYVAGKPLSQILHGRPLPPDKVAAIGFQVARAISCAHRKGLLHRDLKPSNVLVTAEGDVKVADFGLATLFEPRRLMPGSEEPTWSIGHESRRLSAVRPSHGRLVGTIPYMSPEQARGEALDGRSDIFSLGVVLYEMTTGRRPFAGATKSELLQDTQKAMPTPVHELVPKVPLELDRIVQKALARKLGDRYQTMDDFAVDLKQLGRDLDSGSAPSYDTTKATRVPGRRRWMRIGMMAGLVAVLLTVAGIVTTRLVFRARALSVAVAPADLTGDGASSAHVGADFAAAVTKQLAAVPSLRVRPSLTRLRPMIELVRDARDLAASRLVLPRIAVTGSTLIAEWSIVDTSRNLVLPASGFPIVASGYSELASSFARAVAAQLGTTYPKRYDYVPNLVHDPELARIRETSVVAGALRREDLDVAVNASARVASALPNSVAAWAVRAHSLAVSWEAKPAPSLRSELDRALDDLERLDSNNPYSRTYRAIVQWKQGNAGSAIRGLDELLLRADLQPAAIAWLHRLRAQVRSDLGEHVSAWEDLVAAATADPLSAPTFAAMSHALRAAGDLPGSADRARQAVELEPSSWRYRTIAATAFLDQGHVSEAVDAFHAACELSHTQEPCALAAIALWAAGRHADARSAAGVAEALPTSVYGAYNLACFWADAGEPTRAMEMVDKSVDLGLASQRIFGESCFESLRGLTPFKTALEKVNSRRANVPPRDH